MFQKEIGEGGPYEGNDIAVYHVETDFKLTEYDTENDKDTWIWPLCLPKDDSDPQFESNKGMIAGWLDSPPIHHTFTNILGYAGIWTDGDVLRQAIYETDSKQHRIDFPLPQILQSPKSCWH